MDGSRTHDGSYRPDTDFEDQEAHRDFTIPKLRIIQNKPACNPLSLHWQLYKFDNIACPSRDKSLPQEVKKQL